MKLTSVFRDVFDDDSLVIGPALAPNDIPGWDSLTNIRLILTIEKAFGVSFSASDVGNLHDVKDLAGLLQSKLFRGA